MHQLGMAELFGEVKAEASFFDPHWREAISLSL
jgi:hypothetical protein